MSPNNLALLKISQIRERLVSSLSKIFVYLNISRILTFDKCSVLPMRMREMKFARKEFKHTLVCLKSFLGVHNIARTPNCISTNDLKKPARGTNAITFAYYSPEGSCRSRAHGSRRRSIDRSIDRAFRSSSVQDCVEVGYARNDRSRFRLSPDACLSFHVDSFRLERFDLATENDITFDMRHVARVARCDATRLLEAKFSDGMCREAGWSRWLCKGIAVGEGEKTPCAL